MPILNKNEGIFWFKVKKSSERTNSNYGGLVCSSDNLI
jgi:hypothetical protein